VSQATTAAVQVSPRTARLGELTTRDVAEALASGPLDVIVPLGALEQHGPHLPLATDQIIATAVAESVASRVGTCVITPSVPVGASSHHLSFAGTASLADETIVATQVDIVESLLSHGFRSAYVVTGHAGNSGAMTAAVNQLDARVVCFADWPSQRDAVHRVAQDELGLDPDVVGTHAGHFETSIMMLLAPDLVQLDRIEPGFIGPAAQASATLRRDGMAALAANGVIGDPTGANAAAGERYLDALVEHVVTGINAHRTSQEAIALR